MTDMLQHFHAADIADMEKRYRARFINTLSGFKSAHLAGTVNAKGKPNLAILSNVFHVGANPPLMGVLFRPHTVPRDTLENIQATGVFTLNHVSVDLVQRAHQTSARYPAEDSEFDHAGLEPLYQFGFAAPFVAEAPVRIGLKLVERLSIASNQTELVIGEIVHVSIPERAIQPDGFVDISQAHSAAVVGLDAYYQTTLLERMAYAKPECPPTSIPLQGESQ